MSTVGLANDVLSQIQAALAELRRVTGVSRCTASTSNSRTSRIKRKVNPELLPKQKRQKPSIPIDSEPDTPPPTSGSAHFEVKVEESDGSVDLEATLSSEETRTDSDSNHSEVQIIASKLSASTKRKSLKKKRADIDNDDLSFDEWVLWRHNKLHRKRYILVNSDYDILVNACKHKRSLDNNAELAWAKELVRGSNLKVIKEEVMDKNTGEITGIKDTLVKPRMNPSPEEIRHVEELEKQSKESRIINEVVNKLNIFDKYFRVGHLNILREAIEFEHVCGSHCGIKNTYERIKQKYIYITREMVRQYLRRCPTCSKSKAITKKTRKPLQAIDGIETFNHMQIDLIDYSKKPAEEFHYIAHIVDHYSCIHYVEALREKSGKEVLHFLKKTFAFTGYPRILQSDNGGEFVNEQIKTYLQLHGIEYRHSKPYTPTTQGKVERNNRTLKESIVRLVEHSRRQRTNKTWYDVMYEACLSLNTNYSSTINTSPYFHMYHRYTPNPGNIGEISELVKNVGNGVKEDELKNASKANTGNPQEDEDAWSDNELTIMEVENASIRKAVDELNVDTREHYEKNLDKMKKKFDKRRTVHEFKVGDVVGVLIPEEYKELACNNLVCVIVDVKMSSEEKTYRVIHGDYLLESVYFQHDLVPLVGLDHYYGDVTHEEPEAHITKQAALYRRNELIEKTLKTVYEEYLQLQRPGDFALHDENGGNHTDEGGNHTDKHRNDSNKRDAFDFTALVSNIEGSDKHEDSALTTNPNQLALITNKDTGATKLVKVSIRENKCCLCEESLTNANYMQCYGCEKPMHKVNDQCEFGMVKLAYKGHMYCSYSCSINQMNYEVEIVGENTMTKKYKVKYVNGNHAWLTYKTIEGYAQYAKMLMLWRKNNPKLQEYNGDDDDIAVMNVNNADACCTCNEKLSDANPHTCFQCKRSMHGYLICSKNTLIKRDDDKLLCSTKCQDDYVMQNPTVVLQ